MEKTLKHGVNIVFEMVLEVCIGISDYFGSSLMLLCISPNSACTDGVLTVLT